MAFHWSMRWPAGQYISSIFWANIQSYIDTDTDINHINTSFLAIPQILQTQMQLQTYTCMKSYV